MHCARIIYILGMAVGRVDLIPRLRLLLNHREMRTEIGMDMYSSLGGCAGLGSLYILLFGIVI